MKLSPEILKLALKDPQLDHKGVNYVTDCPWCGHREFGIAIYKENHPFQCFRKKDCGEVGTIYKFLKQVDKLYLITEHKAEIDFTAKLPLIETEKKKYDLDTPTINKPFGFKRIYNHPYLESRNFKNYDKYEIGVSLLEPKLRKDYIIILIKEDNELKGYIARNTHTKEYIKKWNSTHDKYEQIIRYKNSEDTDFAKLLLGIDEVQKGATHTIILVEGFFKKDNIDTLLSLDKNPSTKCVASFGAKFSKEQALKLLEKGIQHLIILFDPDAVKQIIDESIEVLNIFESVRIGYHPTVAPDDYGVEECEQVFNNLKDPIAFKSSTVRILKLN